MILQGIGVLANRRESVSLNREKMWIRHVHTIHHMVSTYRKGMTNFPLFHPFIHPFIHLLFTFYSPFIHLLFTFYSPFIHLLFTFYSTFIHLYSFSTYIFTFILCLFCLLVYLSVIFYTPFLTHCFSLIS